MKIKQVLRHRLMFKLAMSLFFFLLSMQNASCFKAQITIKPNQAKLITGVIQNAIDSCAAAGGGAVIFPAGKFLCGGIELKSNVTLQLQKGAILQGSDKYTDYKNDAFIYGKDLENITIQGEGIIDGVDCYNPKGEEGFRGPHCIRLVNCKNISLTGFTIKNSANWAINCRYSSFATVKNVTILGGHDGLHTRFCNNFIVMGCDFRTGDDAFAGNDNRDFVITDCKVNTSCNGFRMGCLNFTVQRCKIWGPGEYIHKIQKRSNMLSAFVHFSPKDERSVLKSGNWLIEDIMIENVDHVYNYNFEKGLWQTGQPVTKVRFKKVKATGILSAFNIIGDEKLNFNLDVQNSVFSFREGTVYNANHFEGAKLTSSALLNASNFNDIQLHKVVFEKKDAKPVLNFISGNRLTLDRVSFITGSSTVPYNVNEVGEVNKEKLKLN